MKIIYQLTIETIHLIDTEPIASSTALAFVVISPAYAIRSLSLIVSGSARPANAKRTSSNHHRLGALVVAHAQHLIIPKSAATPSKNNTHAMRCVRCARTLTRHDTRPPASPTECFHSTRAHTHSQQQHRVNNCAGANSGCQQDSPRKHLAGSH